MGSQLSLAARTGCGQEHGHGLCPSKQAACCWESSDQSNSLKTIRTRKVSGLPHPGTKFFGGLCSTQPNVIKPMPTRKLPNEKPFSSELNKKVM